MGEIIEREVTFDNLDEAMNLFGHFDENIKILEEALSVHVSIYENRIRISGNAAQVQKAESIIHNLLDIAARGDIITTQNVRYLIEMAGDEEENMVSGAIGDSICITAKGRPIKSKTLGQKKYVDAIKNNVITFGIGPAGTGKTFLAVAMAVNAFRNKEVSRIILTRPAVEAGEKLGFLPGDLQNKVDPYLRPLYDALYEIMGGENFQKNFDKGLIEVAPLAYMRGRTLDDSFIILDEAQNTTSEQMKMFLTRTGFGSKVVVTGDITQIDLPKDKTSGLIQAINVLKDVEGLEFVFLTDKDVIRHELVQRIIRAYDKYSSHDKS